MSGSLPTGHRPGLYVKLSPNIRSLSAKVAHEQHRRAMWESGAALRDEALTRMRGGEPEAQVQNWLKGELARAVEAQSMG